MHSLSTHCEPLGAISIDIQPSSGPVPASCNPGAPADATDQSHKAAHTYDNNFMARKRGREPGGCNMPAWARLQQHALPPGPLTVKDITWQVLQHGKAHALVALIPEDRLRDFAQGESDRGTCEIHINSHHNRAGKKDERGRCKFQPPRKLEHRHKQARAASELLLASKAGTVSRLGKHQAGTSCKMGCKYEFYVKRSPHAPSLVCLKFSCAQEDTPQTCKSMKHETEAGHPAHTVNDTHHLRRFTEEVDRLIIEQLGMPVKPAAIIAAVKDWVLAKVGATDAMSAEERMRAVRSSVYAKDFLTDHNRISRLRRKLSATEPEPDHEARDADIPVDPRVTEARQRLCQMSPPVGCSR